MFRIKIGSFETMEEKQKLLDVIL